MLTNTYVHILHLVMGAWTVQIAHVFALSAHLRELHRIARDGHCPEAPAVAHRRTSRLAGALRVRAVRAPGRAGPLGRCRRGRKQQYCTCRIRAVLASRQGRVQNQGGLRVRGLGVALPLARLCWIRYVCSPFRVDNPQLLTCRGE